MTPKVRPAPRRSADAVAPRMGRLWLAVALLFSVVVRADEPVRLATVEYRRYFVPADRPQDWPKGGVSYLPVDRDEFERLVEAANSVPLGKPAAGAARISAAFYEATLEAGDRLVGEARLEISAPRNAPLLLPLTPFGLCVEDAVWQASGNAKAVVGVDANQQYSVLVEGSDTLILRWSIAGHREPDGSLRFPLELPRAPVARMRVELPPGLTPAIAAGVLAEEGAAGEKHRWEFELGGRAGTSLILSPDEGQSRRRRLTLLQEHVDYRFTPGGLEVAAQLQLDVHHQPLRRLEIELDGGLRLVAAQQGGAHLSWSDTEGQPAGSSRAVLEFPEPLLGPGRTILVTAIAPLVLDQSWTLPRVRVQGVVWQEGSASLVVPAPLSLEELLPLRCRQSKSGSVGSARSSDTFDLQFFSPEATARVLFRWRKPRATLSSANNISLSGDDCQADFHGWFEVDEGESFLLTAGVADGWRVDSVVSVPPGAVSTWTMEDLGASRSLVVQLAEPLSPSRPVKLRIGGRRAALADASFAEAGLRMVQFRDVALADQLLALTPEDPYQLRLEGAAQPRMLRREDLTAAQRRLIGDIESESWIDLAATQPGWAVKLEPRTPRYAAEIVVDALIAQQQVTESYLVRCDPDGAKLDRVLVHFGQARSAPPRWETAPEVGPLTAQRVSSPASAPVARNNSHRQDEAASALAAGTDTDLGETWEVRLARPSEKPFELRASRETTWDDSLALSLVSLDGATSQQALVRVRAEDAAPEIVIAERLAPPSIRSLDHEAIAAMDDVPPCAVYRYDPLLELGPPSHAAVIHRPPRDARRAVVWQLQLQSQLSVSGRTAHRALLYLQNRGQRDCRFRLPAEIELLMVRIDGTTIQTEAAGNELRVLLPPRQEFALLSIDYASSNPSPHLVGRCQAIWPEIDLPVMSREWFVSVPRGYLCWNESHGAAKLPSANWRERLFGPLGRVDDRPFDPRWRDDWRSLAAFTMVSEEWLPTTVDGVSPPLPWRRSVSDDNPDVSLGWCQYRVDANGGPTTAWFVHRGAIETARWAIAAIVAGIGLSMRRGPTAWVILAGAAAVAMIWLPAALAPLASGLWLGALISLIGRVWRPSRHQQSRVSSDSAAGDRSATVARPAAIASAIGLLAFSLCTSRAADDEPLAQRGGPIVAADQNVHRVFIPINSSGQPVGRYQVPTDLLLALRRYAGLPDEQLGGWLLTAARYQCTLGRDEVPAPIRVSELSLEFHLHVFDGESPIRIPLDRSQAALVADSAMLDDQPIELAWDDAGRAVVCDVDESGDYVLRFRVVPQTNDDGEFSSFELAVPRVPSARLEIIAPVEAMPIEAAGALGATAGGGEHRLLVDLGPVPTLAVRWNQRVAAEAPVAEVEELLWLKIQPGSVVLDARLNFKITSGVLRRVEIAADHRLWRIPSDEGASPGLSERISPGEPLTASSPQLVQLDLAHPVDDQLSLNLPWLLTGSSGVGNLRLPAFEVLGVRHTRRWLAVTVDSGLEYDIHNDERLEGLPPADFASVWGGPEAASLRDALVYRIPETQTDWSLATRPREPQTTVKEQLALSFDRGGALVEYDAQLRTTAGFVFEHRLIVPRELTIDHISLEEDGTERLARWGRDDSGVVTIFLNRRVTGPQRLLLRGRLPMPGDGRMSLPTLTMEPGDPAATTERAEILDRTVRIYRQPSAAVAISGAHGLIEIAESGADASKGRLGRLVAAYGANRGVSATLTITPNEPRIHSVAQLVSLDFIDQSWIASCELRLTVDDGVLDVLRLEVPPNWDGPFTIVPSAAIEVYHQPGKNAKQLVLYPRAPLQGPVSIRLEAPLKLAPGDPIAAPQVVPQLPDAECFFALPVQVGLEQVLWDTARLVGDAPPEVLADTGVSPERFYVYRAVGQNPQATLTTATQTADVAHVRLADLSLGCHDGVWRAVAAFDLDPGGRTSCPLQISPGWKLLEVWVEGVAATPSSAAEAEWLVPLHSARLPQRIEILAAGPLAPRHPLPVFPLRLGDLPVQETLLAVAAPPGRELESLPEAEYCDTASCSRVRLDALSALLNLPQELVATTPAEELAAWFRPWARRLAEAHQLNAQRPPAGKSASFPADWFSASRRVGGEALLKSLAASPVEISQPLLLWEQAQKSESVHYRIRGAAPMVHWQPKFAASYWLHVFLTALVAVICVAAIAALRHPTVRDAWRRWPQLLVVMAGLGWWLYLQPSAVGFAFMLGGVWSAMRSIWRTGF